jgi:hypothetical protein
MVWFVVNRLRLRFSLLPTFQGIKERSIKLVARKWWQGIMVASVRMKHISTAGSFALGSKACLFYSEVPSDVFSPDPHRCGS